MTPPRIWTRSVNGRTASPYRGATNDDPHGERPPAPGRALAELGERLRKLPDTEYRHFGRRFDLKRGDAALVIICRGEQPALADLTVSGDPLLAIAALEALVPLYGAIEVAVHDYRDLVDESEPGSAAARYDQHVRERLAQADAARIAFADQLVKAQPPPRTKLWAVAILGGAVLVIALIWAVLRFSRAGVGEACLTDGDCRSGECVIGAGGAELESVCSEACQSNSDCPSGMKCRRHVWADYGEIRNMCQPVHWTLY